MSINSRKRRQSLILIGTLLIFMLLIGFSYSMFTANVIKTNKTETAIKTKVMGLIYTGRSDIDETGIFPGNSFEKTFTVENVTAEASWYNIYMENITNDYGEDLVYTLYETDSNYENTLKTVVSEKKLPETVNGKKYLKTRIDIEAQPKTHYYKMVIEYKEREEAQPYNSNDKFEGTVGIDQNTEAEEDLPDIDPENDYTITINPNGGIYEESLDVQTVVRRGGETYEVLVPQRVGHTFAGWEVSDSYSYKNNIVTIYSNNVTLKAKWSLTDDTIAVAQIVRTGTLYARIQDAEDAAQNNDTIKILKDTSEVFANSKTVTIDFDDNTVTGKLNNTGDITLINGTLQNTNDYAINNTGTLTLGINDGTVDIDDIAIKSDVEHNSLKQDGTMKFYDGYVEGKVAISGPVNETPEGYVTYIEHKTSNGNDYQKAYLILEETASTRAVAKRIDGTPILYYNLEDAILNSVESGKTVYAIRDFQASYELYVPATSENDIVFDIDGYTVETGNTITNSKNFKITNGKNTGTLQISLPFTNTGSMEFENIIINATTSANILVNSGLVDIKNSTLTSTGGYALSLSGGTVTMDNDTYLYSRGYAVYNNSTNGATIDGGNIRGIESYGKLTIDSGRVYNGSNNYAIYSSTDLTINDINLTSTKDGIYAIKNNFTINDGHFESNYAIIRQNNENNTTMVINGGTFVKSSTSSSDACIRVTSLTSLTINGGTITNNVGAGVEVASAGWNSPRLLITGGEISGSTYGVNLSEDSSYYEITGGRVYGGQYGVYIASDSTLNIGTKDNNINTSAPEIIGGMYAVYTHDSYSGKFNFYDGKIKGVTACYNSRVNDVESGADIVTESEEIDGEEYTVKYLELQENFLEVNGIEYNSFSEAVDSAQAGDTVYVIRDGNIRSTYQIAYRKNITLDLNGHNLTFSTNIGNNAVLSIIDSSSGKTGVLLTNDNATAITSSGTLNIDGITIKNTSPSNWGITTTGGTANIRNVNIVDSYSGMSFAGTATIENSNIKTTRNSLGASRNGYITIINSNIESTDRYCINIVYGSATLNSGSLKSNTSTAVYAVNQGTFTMNGGTVLSENDAGITGDNISTSITINNGTVTGTKGVIAKGTLKVYDGTITGTTTGIEGSPVVEAGTISGGTYGINGAPEVKSGTITGGTYGIYNTSLDKQITLGVDDDNVINDPQIMGGDYGVYITKGSINFYDGIVKGQTAGYTGTINSIADSTTIKADQEVIEGVTYNVNYLAPGENFLELNGVEYNSFAKALAQAGSGDTITVIADTVIKSETSIPSGKDIILDMNGHTLNLNYAIVNSGTMQIINSSNQAALLSNLNSVDNRLIIENKGTLSIDNVHLQSRSTNITNARNKTLTVSNCEFENGSGIDNDGIATITASIFNLDALSIDTDYRSQTTINSGTYNNLTLGGTVTINNGTFKSIILWTGATVNFYDGIVQSDNTKDCAVNVSYDAENVFNMYGGKIISETKGMEVWAGAVNIYDGEIISNDIGIHIANWSLSKTSTTHIYGGKIQSKTYGVYLSKSGSTVIIGDNDASISTTNPEIIGDTYAVYLGNGTASFYDGVLKGVTDAVYGQFIEIPKDTIISSTTTTENEKQYINYYLTAESDVVTDGTNNYTNIQDAIDAVGNNATLTLLKDTSVYYEINVPSEKTLTIDMAGYDIYLSMTMNNDGNLKLYSSGAKSQLSTRRSIAILKNDVGTLDMSNVEFLNNTTNYYTFENNNIATLDNVSFRGYAGIKNNTADSDITITNADIDVTNYAIYNTGKISLDGGSYNGSYGIYDVSSKANTMENITTAKVYFDDASNNEFDNTTFNGNLTNHNANGIVSVDNSTMNSNVENRGTMYISDSDYINTERINGMIYLANYKNMEVTNAKFKATSPNNSSTIYGVYNSESNSTFKCTSCEFEITSTSSSAYGIGISNSSLVELDDVSIKINGSVNNTTGYGIEIYNGKAVLKNTTIDVGNSRYAYGIYINNGEVTMGEKEDSTSPNYGTVNANVSTTNPSVKAIGSTTGIGVKKVNGKFNFYDGIIIGSTAAKPEIATDVEYGFEAPLPNYEPTNGDGYKTSYLYFLTD